MKVRIMKDKFHSCPLPLDTIGQAIPEEELSKVEKENESDDDGMNFVDEMERKSVQEEKTNMIVNPLEDQDDAANEVI